MPKNMYPITIIINSLATEKVKKCVFVQLENELDISHTGPELMLEAKNEIKKTQKGRYSLLQNNSFFFLKLKFILHLLKCAVEHFYLKQSVFAFWR